MINISSVSALRTMPRALAFSGRRLLSSVPVVIRTCHAARPLGTALREAVCWDDRRAPSGCPARGMASYSGRGKPTRTREREREDQASTDSQTRNAPPLARRQQEETPYQDDERQPRQMDSLSDPGLKKFMVSICESRPPPRAGPFRISCHACWCGQMPRLGAASESRRSAQRCQ